MKNKKWRSVSAILAVAFLIGCAPAASVFPTERATASPTPTTAVTPDPDADVKALCEQYGLQTEDLRGKYDLFRSFSAAIESNDGDQRFDIYKPHVYRVFPVIAAHEEMLDPSCFFDALSQLTIRRGDAGSGNAGVYYDGSVQIVLSDDADHVVYHELMHFIDFRIARSFDGVWYRGNEVMSYADHDRFIEQGGDEDAYAQAWDCHSNFLVEAGAELFNAKYCSHAIASYYDPVSYLTALEYLFGTEKIEEVFFSPDSDVLFARLFLNAGWSLEEYSDLCQALNALTAREAFGDFDKGNPTDRLIDLYTALRKGDWEQDRVFTYLLASCNGIALDDWRESRYASKLEKHVFKSFSAYEQYQNGILMQTDASLSFNVLPPPLMFVNGETVLACGAKMTVPDGETREGAVCIHIDLNTNTVLGWKFEQQRM